MTDALNTETCPHSFEDCWRVGTSSWAWGLSLMIFRDPPFRVGRLSSWGRFGLWPWVPAPSRHSHATQAKLERGQTNTTPFPWQTSFVSGSGDCIINLLDWRVTGGGGHQEEGVPQGSVFSVLCFIIVMDIVARFLPDTKFTLYHAAISCLCNFAA